MRVCFVAPQVVCTIQGGLRTQIEQTARHLPAAGVDVTLFDQWTQFDVGAYDLVHIFRAGMSTYELATYLAGLAVPYVVSPVFYTRRSFAFVRRTLAVERAVQPYFSGFMSEWSMSRAICEHAQAVYPNTTHEADFFADGMGIPRSRITVVPNGVDERFAEADPALFVETYGLNDFILYVGNVGAERKNALGFIRAVRDIDHPAVIIGPIYDNAYARRCLEEARSNPGLRILGPIANDSPLLASAYAACRVFALPSYFETPGIAALEAGLAGARVVITQHGGTTDYFSSLARYVDPTSTESIARAIREALAEPPSDALRRHIGDTFLWQHVAARTAREYAKVVGHIHRERPHNG